MQLATLSIRSVSRWSQQGFTCIGQSTRLITCISTSSIPGKALMSMSHKNRLGDLLHTDYSPAAVYLRSPDYQLTIYAFLPFVHAVCDSDWVGCALLACFTACIDLYPSTCNLSHWCTWLFLCTLAVIVMMCQRFHVHYCSCPPGLHILKPICHLCES